MIMVSFEPTERLGFSPFAMRCRALIGSPWLPVQTIITSSSRRFLVREISTSTPSGMDSSPSFCAVSTTLSMLLPLSASLRLWRTAISTICCSLCTLEANVAIMTRLAEFSPTRRSSVSPTTASDMV